MALKQSEPGHHSSPDILSEEWQKAGIKVVPGTQMMIYENYCEAKPPWQCWLGQCLLTIGKKRQVWEVDSLSLRDVQASWAENHLEKKLTSFKVSVRWYKTCRKLRSSATLPLEASLSAVLSCFDPDWRYRLTAVEMSPSANLIWEEHIYDKVFYAFGPNFF